MMNQAAFGGAVVGSKRYVKSPTKASSESGSDPCVSIDLTYYTMLAVRMRNGGRRAYEGIMLAVAGWRELQRLAG